MKKSILPILGVFLLAGSYTTSQAQNDDLYFDGTEVAYNEVYTRYIDKSSSNNNKESYGDDEYVDEANYDYAYSSRIRRFERRARGFSYYSNYYIDNYYYDPYMAGNNIYNTNNNWSPYYNYNSNWGWNNGFNNGWCRSVTS